MALLKSGWIWRQSSVFRRWKLSWADLWIDGSLCFYSSERRRGLDLRVGLKTNSVDVKHGLECGDVSPPESNPRENLLVIQLRDGSTVNLCANSEDEALAWKLTMLETRRNPVFSYDPYDDYEAVPLNRYHTVYISPGAGPGCHQVIVRRDPFDDITENLVLGLLTGIAAGAALRSFLWMPLFFC